MKRDKIQIMIDEIMDYFDFAKVLKTMQLLEWKILTEEGHMVPEYESDLRVKARKLIMHCIDTSNEYHYDNCFVRTGPFKVTCSRDNDEISKIELEFVVCNWDAYSEDYE